ncbi:M4 family metallopeptidase [Staphylococcus warneri]
MNRLSKTIISGISVITISSTFYSEEVDAKNDHSANQNKLEVKYKNKAFQALKLLPNDKNAKKQFKHYKTVDVNTDQLGYTHYTLQPKFKNAYVPDREVKIHTNPQGKVVLINGDTGGSEIKPSNTVQIHKKEAINKAFEAISMSSDKAKNFKNDVIKKNQIQISGQHNKYVYQVEIVTTSPKISHWNIQVDAETGEVIDKINNIQHAHTEGTGKSVLNKTKKININSKDKGYELKDVTHKGNISAYDYNDEDGSSKLMTDKDKEFVDKSQHAAVDANDYAKDVYDYYKNKFGRESYDDKGSPIDSLTHVNQFENEDNRNNAAWIGDKMIYGDGDNDNYLPFSGAKDVVAHEITHGITQETANLVYENQPGALNESFSDVFAYFIDSDNFLIGEDIYTPNVKGDALRSMSNPEKYDQPAHMKYYSKTQEDNGGVHTNSGIPNKAAYLTIKRIGKDKAEQIYYRTLTHYLSSNSDFEDAKKSLHQAALDLYDKSTADQVNQSWEDVGV